MTDIDRDIQQWVKLSEYDLVTAEAMLKSGRYLYVLFCCQQALEKYLKALVVREIKGFPPRTHDLMRLTTLAQIEIDDKKESFLRRITNYYIGTRYPEEVSRLTSEVSKQLAMDYFQQTKETVKWLEGFLK